MQTGKGKIHFAEGSLVLLEDISTEEGLAFHEANKARIDAIIRWANQNALDIAFGCNDLNGFVCEYRFSQTTRKGNARLVKKLTRLLQGKGFDVRIGYELTGYSAW